MRTLTRMIQALSTCPPRPPGKESEAMNIAMTERKPAAAQPLKDKVALITGSTSGIGLGIARALAGAGSAIVLNGFGKPDEILAINLSSAFHTTRLSLPAMIANKWGRIINIASAHGLVGSAYKSAYVAAKHGMLGLTKVTALEVAEQGITCNAICPGYVYTPLVEA